MTDATILADVGLAWVPALSDAFARARTGGGHLDLEPDTSEANLRAGSSSGKYGRLAARKGAVGSRQPRQRQPPHRAGVRVTDTDVVSMHAPQGARADPDHLRHPQP